MQEPCRRKPLPTVGRARAVSARRNRLIRIILSSLAAGAATVVQAAPPLDEPGRAGYADYRQAEGHRAFAIAPGGAWAWRGGMPDADTAVQAAVEDCQGHARRRCLAYDVNGKVVLDSQAWAGAWRPYAGKAQAARAAEGVKPGQRFPDLAYTDAAGKPRRLADDRGKVVLLHFWGSWCPPCQREMPDLQKLHARFKSEPDILFVFLPVREPVSRSREWARARGMGIPIADGGPAAAKDGAFLRADGRRIGDRELAGVFPTTYVIDRQGLVLFAHFGPVPDWASLAPLIRDAAANSGR
mgnify:CR=1 FL=1